MISYKDRVKAANNIKNLDVSSDDFIKNLCVASGSCFDESKSESGNIELLKDRLSDLVMPDKYVQETINDINPELQNKLVEICNMLSIQTDDLVDALSEIKSLVMKDRVPDNVVWPKYSDDSIATIGDPILIDEDPKETSVIKEIVILDSECTKVVASDGCSSFVVDRNLRLDKPPVEDESNSISIEDLPETMTKEEVVKLLEKQKHILNGSEILS